LVFGLECTGDVSEEHYVLDRWRAHMQIWVLC